jgi:hypothetical protein
MNKFIDPISILKIGFIKQLFIFAGVDFSVTVNILQLCPLTVLRASLLSTAQIFCGPLLFQFALS